MADDETDRRGERDAFDGFELDFPFIVTRPEGGPYDADSFAAGVIVGKVERTLAALAVLHHGGYRALVFKELAAQLDLVAMHHGFLHTRVEPLAPGEHTPGMIADWVHWSCSREPFTVD